MIPGRSLAAGLLAAVLAAALPGAPAAAQGFDLARQAPGAPIEVLADQGIEWVQGSRTVVARGNATAIRGRVTVRGDTLTAHYRERNGENEIWKLEADGNVSISTPTEKVTGSHAVYDVDSARVLVTGDPVRLVTPTDEVVAKDRLEYHEPSQTAVAVGDAVATRGDKRIRADRLIAAFRETPKGELELDRATAEGSVVLTTQREVVTGDRGEYDAETGIATLTGSVKITRDEHHLDGGYAQVNMNTGVSRLLAGPPGSKGARQRVQGIFVPEREGEAAGGGLPPGQPSGNR